MRVKLIFPDKTERIGSAKGEGGPYTPSRSQRQNYDFSWKRCVTMHLQIKLHRETILVNPPRTPGQYLSETWYTDRGALLANLFG